MKLFKRRKLKRAKYKERVNDGSYAPTMEELFFQTIEIVVKYNLYIPIELATKTLRLPQGESSLIFGARTVNNSVILIPTDWRFAESQSMNLHTFQVPIERAYPMKITIWTYKGWRDHLINHLHHFHTVDIARVDHCLSQHQCSACLACFLLLPSCCWSPTLAS